MESLVIEGGVSLKGEVEVSGAKNAALPIFAATLLSDQKCIIKNVPDLSDIRFMADMLKLLGAEVENPSKGTWVIQAKDITHIAPYELVRKMRASICLLGPLVGRLNKAQVSLPGGCVIGSRPIDLHIKGLKALNCNVDIKNGYLHVDARRLKGNNIYLGGRFGSTVTGTANILMAAVKAIGTTVIENAACEPEIVDLCNMLNKMGALIEGMGSPTLTITGVPKLGGVEHKVIPDRIEAATWIIATLATKGQVLIKGARKKHLSSLLDILDTSTFEYRSANSIYIDAKNADLKPIEAITLPYPGLPTDIQAQLCTLMTQTQGISIITERIYPERFMHIPELARMGADINRESASAIIKGKTNLSGAPVMASDLRASAALVIAGLVAEGSTQIQRIYHLDRGYDSFDSKLKALGAKIKRI